MTKLAKPVSAPYLGTFRRYERYALLRVLHSGLLIYDSKTFQGDPLAGAIGEGTKKYVERVEGRFVLV